jgi:hypothetical protein
MLQLPEKIDTATARQLHAEFLRAVPLEVDASRVKFVSFAGLQVLIAAARDSPNLQFNGLPPFLEPLVRTAVSDARTWPDVTFDARSIHP